MPMKDNLSFHIPAAVVMAQKQIRCFVAEFSLTVIAVCGVWGRGWRLKARQFPRLNAPI
jgi:hypothetical protein